MRKLVEAKNLWIVILICFGIQQKTLAEFMGDNFNSSTIAAEWYTNNGSWIIDQDELKQTSGGAGKIYHVAAQTCNTAGEWFSLSGITRLGSSAASAWIGLVVNYNTVTAQGIVCRYSGNGTVQMLRPNGSAFLNVASAFSPVMGRPYRITVFSTEANKYGMDIFDTVTETSVYSATAVNSGSSLANDGVGGFFGNANICRFDEFHLKNSESTYFIDAESEALSGVSGRVYSDTSAPIDDSFYVVTWKQGNVTNPASWSVGDLTGYYPAGTPSLYQMSSGFYGRSAVQIKDTTFGLFVNTWPCDAPYGNNNYSSIITYRMSEHPAPWAAPEAELSCVFEASVNALSVLGSGVPYIGPSFVLIDKSISKACWLGWRFWDPRGASTFEPEDENIMWDTGTASPMARSHPGATRYTSTKEFSSSYQTGIFTNWTLFGYTVTRQNIINMANDLNEFASERGFDYQYSTDPDDWEIGSFILGLEIHCETEADDRNAGVKVRNIHLFAND